MLGKNYYAYSEEEILQKFQTSKDGLTTKEANRRISRDGRNELPKKKPDSILKIFLGEVKDPIILLLIVAIIASLIVGEYVDAFAIFAIITVDLILGTFQEKKANNTAEALSNLVREKVKVQRDGHEVLVDSEELAIGDIVFLESGDKIAADLRILECHNFTVDESILTGESLAVMKNTSVIKKDKLPITSQTNMLFGGTSVSTGRAVAVVIKIGLDTEIGKIAETINRTKEEKSPLTIRVERFSKQITILISIISIIIAILLWMKQVPFEEILLSVIALGVSAMPEGLPLALTMALTIASNKMAKHKVVAKKLYSVESLGSCTVIASDKTGTLTVNEQTAKKILLPNNTEYLVTGTGYKREGTVTGENIKYAKELALLGVINNEARFEKNERIGDSVDLAFLVLGDKLNVRRSQVEILESIPYESSNRYSAVFYKKDGETYVTVKGSLEKVTSFCNKVNFRKGFDKKLLEQQNEDLAADGYRVITIANGKIPSKKNYSEADIKNLTFMGMVGFIDPIRKEVVWAIQKCRTAGIKVLMVTGDHPLTAYKIARDLKLVTDYDEVTTGEEVEEYRAKGKAQFDKFVQSKKVFTRVTPIQKLRIVESIKRQGEFVAVTGDGVNDAPALRTANIGIAMGSGTDIARETSKMIVLDDNFTSIVRGISEGRVAYSNIRKITYFLISCGLAEVLFYLLSVLFDMPMPLLAIQLLWLNVVTDGIQDFALSFEKAEKNIMNEPPRDPKESLFDKTLFSEIILSGVTIGLIVFGVWYYLINILHMDASMARGYSMALMIIIQNIHAFNCRSEKRSVFTVSIRSNYIFLFGIIGSIILGLAVMEIDFLSVILKTSSIPYLHLLYLFLIGLVILVVMEVYKLIRYRNK